MLGQYLYEAKHAENVEEGDGTAWCLSLSVTASAIGLVGGFPITERRNGDAPRRAAIMARHFRQ